MLYKNRKFDIRIWAIVTSSLDFYFYNVGYLRTSSAEYSTDQMEWTEYDSFEYDNALVLSDYTYDNGTIHQTTETRRTTKLVSPTADVQTDYLPNIRLNGVTASTDYYVRIKKVDGASTHYSPIV